jgi:hypothetical protein
MTKLQISSQQMNAFDQSMLKEFRIFMLDQLRESAQDVFAGQTDQDILDYVDKGITRAQSYGADQQAAYGMFISACVLLGDDFDTNGKYPWAEAALKDPEFADANARMDNLMVQVALYFDATDVGEEGSENE